MKTLFALPAALLLLPASLFAQGPLPPPAGTPVPTMKSLDQIEPRTPIPPTGPFPFTISASGSYYLTGNVTVATGDAIVINANDVTLDLAGFTISSTSPTLSGKGILIDGSLRTNVSIANGFIRGTSVYNFGSNTVTGGGFAEAVGANGSLFGGAESALAPTAVRISSLGISGLGEGIRLNSSSVSNVVENTTVSNVQGAGIRAGVIANSTADRTGGVAISGRSVSNVGGSRYTAGPAVDPAPVAPLVRADLDTRTAIPAGTATFTITTPGSYVLAGNITVATGHGIVIQADDVTLDLGGFTLASTSATATGDAINFSGARARIAIFNGHIRSGVTNTGGTFSNGPGFDSGINWPSSQPAAIRVSDISITGVKSFGIDVGTDSSSIVRACTVRVAGGIGIRAGVVSDSSVINAGTTTISAGRIHNSIGARADGGGPGISTTGPTLESVAAAATAGQTAATAVQSTATATQNTVNSTAGILNDTQGTVLATQSTLSNVQTALNATQTTVNATASTVNNALVNSRDRRTPVSIAGSFLGPGSFYLTQDLTVATGTCITIVGPDTTLDLNGFTISSTSAAHNGNGILINSTARNVKITNGHIVGTTTGSGASYSGGGFLSGINCTVATANVIVRDVQVSGVRTGMSLLTGLTVVESCLVRTCSLMGIEADTVRTTTVANALDGGINAASVIGCTVTGINGLAVQASLVDTTYALGGGGIASFGGTVSNSRGEGTVGDGIFGNVVTGSVGNTTSSNNGISAEESISNSFGSATSGDGIYTLNGVVTNSSGLASGGGGTALRAFTANGSRGRKAGAVSQIITNKYNMP